MNLRRNAIEQFKSSGFPTARRGNEEWKYTDVGPIAKSSFCIPKPHSILFSGEDQIENLCIGSADWTKLVFINGKYSNSITIANENSSQLILYYIWEKNY